MSTELAIQPCCLVVEDQALIAMSIEAYLEDEGFEVETVTSIAQARAWLEQADTPKLAILDFMLKDGPATEFAAELRRRGIPFVVYSGYPRALGVPSELEEVPWLEKPMGRDELLNALMSLPAQMSPIASLNS
ncbi:response regulator [Microvirga aerophila]|nr:response regulator [Microvirga aerophila]